jgi:inositol phosphorylceramide synthase catalytic subunit
LPDPARQSHNDPVTRPSASLTASRRPPLPYAAGALAIAAYVALMYLLGGIGWQHLGLSVLIWACLTGVPGPRRFVRDWWPMIVFWLSYDVMRVFSPHLFPRVSVEAPFRWESSLFLSPGGVIWPYYFTRWAAAHRDQFGTGVLAGYLNLVYLSQVFAVPLIMFGLWARGKNLLFRRLVWGYTVLHAVGLAVYIAYPAAPPWWVYENGFVGPTLARSTPLGFSSGSVLSGLFHMSPNRFAAIPSLHGAYPLLLTLVLALHGAAARWIVLAGCYAASMWFACVYLNQHYIVDLLLGAAIMPLSLLAASRVKEA